MAAKLHAAQEKARQAKEFLRHFEDCAKAAESEYNLQLLPSLCEDIRMIEEEATLYLKSWFENMLGLEKSYLEKRLNALSGLSER